MTTRFLTKALPVLAAAALLIPAGRKLLDGSWRDQLGASYQLGDRDIGGNFFILVGLLELVLAVAILWPKTRVPAAFAMVGFFVGVLFFNLVLRLDQELLPSDQLNLSTLIPFDMVHLLLGLAVALLSQRSQRLPGATEVVTPSRHA